MSKEREQNDVFADRLKELVREKKKDGKGLRDIAKDVGVCPGILSDWQNGNKAPRSDSIVNLARYFDVSADYMLGLTDEKKTRNQPKRQRDLDDETMKALANDILAKCQEQELSYAEMRTLIIMLSGRLESARMDLEELTLSRLVKFTPF